VDDHELPASSTIVHVIVVVIVTVIVVMRVRVRDFDLRAVSSYPISLPGM
jgi:hypothetical protein